MKRILMICLMALGMAPLAFGIEGDEIWTGTYNGSANGNDVGQGTAVDSSGNVYVTGYEDVTGEGNNIWVRKYNSAGAVQWTGTSNGTANGSDAGYGIAVDSAGNVYVTGYEYVTGQGDNIWTRKYNSAGTEQWTRTYNGTANSYDEGQGIAVDSSGNVYVTGHEEVTGQVHNIWVRKYNSAGTEQWTRTYNGIANNDDRGQGIAVDSSGNVYVTGHEDVTGQANNIWVRKYNSFGTETWTRTHNDIANSSDGGQGIAVDSSGNVYVTGHEYVTGQVHNIWVRKYNAAGTEQWTRTYNGTANGGDGGQGIAVDSSGDVYATGYEYVTGQDYNIWVRKYEGGGPGTITNTAYLYYENLIGTKFVSTATVSVVCEGGVQNPNIVVTKTVDPATGVTRGSTLTYNITLHNTGAGAAKSVVVTDQVPAGTEYITSSAEGPSVNIIYSHDGGATYDGSDAAPVTNIKWSLISDLAADAAVSVRFKVQVR